jgi:hypothetical protein
MSVESIYLQDRHAFYGASIELRLRTVQGGGMFEGIAKAEMLSLSECAAVDDN